MNRPQRIGVLTGGGDCPGLNAVIRAVTKDAIHHGIDVLGIEDGFLGLIENRVHPLHDEHVSNILQSGGTVLGSSNKANPKRFAVGLNPDGTPNIVDLTDRCMEHIQEHAIDALVVIGGDGTMTVASNFVNRGVNCIGVPKTIDNDLWGTDITFGFATAVQTASDAIDRVRTTAASHHRVMVVEVMGRNAGWLALHAGLAGGADIILLPEIPFSVESITAAINTRRQHGKRYTIICCSEGAAPIGGQPMVERVVLTSPDPIRLGGIGRWVANQIEESTQIETRYVVLGHVQRGGTPVASDRVLATLFGDHAMNLLLEGKRDRLVVHRNGLFTDTPLTESADKQRLVQMDDPAMAAARSVGTTFGEPLG
jgi:ATP-dependent phosphofructokinase / diphosphate-dependent phosphofructokinase